MGKKLDALLGRTSTFKSKLNPLLNLALSRLSVLKNQRLSRRSYAQSNVFQLLSLPAHHHRALLRVEQVIKEDNMIDAFVMLEGYCFLILERMNLLQQQRECPPEELNEAVSSLLFASSRCGEFPELQEIRSIFTRKYGKEFAARAIELRNNCSVNRQIVLKLSPRQPSLENRLKVLEKIAAENNIVLQIEEITDEKQVVIDQKPVMNNFDESMEVEGLSDSVKMRRRQYKDVADAAQAAFESAAYAAEAARAAVELSKPGPHHHHHHHDDDDDRGMPGKNDGNEIENKYEITEVEEEQMLETRKGQEAVRHEKANENEISFDESEEDEIINEQSKASDLKLTKEVTRDEEAVVAVQKKIYPAVDFKESSDDLSMKKKMEKKPASVRTRRRRLWL